MNESPVIVSDLVLAKAAVDGDNGRGWADALPGIVAELEDLWSLRISEPLTGGTSAYVARATTDSGDHAVVKIAVPTPDFEREVRTLELAEGRGYVRLLAHDVTRQAMLLEPLGPCINRVGYSPEQQLRTMAAVLPQLWKLPLRDERGHAWAGGPVDKAAGLHGLISEHRDTLDQPCPERVITRALEFADRLSTTFDPELAVVVHGDAATANLLQVPTMRPGAEAGFAFVDPSTFVGDRTYDLGVALQGLVPELIAGNARTLARGWCRALAADAGVDEVAVWRWAYLERVSTGLYVESLGGNGQPHLLTAALLCDEGPPA